MSSFGIGQIYSLSGNEAVVWISSAARIDAFIARRRARKSGFISMSYVVYPHFIVGESYSHIVFCGFSGVASGKRSFIHKSEGFYV
jgi:hypothetical protein